MTTLKHFFKLSAGTIGVVAIAMPAQASGFTGFNFDATTTFAGDPTADIFLQSVTGNGSTIDDFSFVTAADVILNGSSLGPASTDLGDNATSPNAIGANETPSAEEIVAFLGNRNLNNIIDTEDNGEAILELGFDDPVNTFYVFERGLNSGLTLEALDAGGAVIDNFRISPELFASAGFSIDTTEIRGAQEVGAFGLRLDQSVDTLRVISNGAIDNGPDYKIVAAQVPEPGSMAALALAGGAALVTKRRKQAA